MNNRSLLSCRNEIKQNFMAHSYAGYLRTEIIYVNPIDPYARCAGEFCSLKKKKATLSSRKLIKQNWKICCDENATRTSAQENRKRDHGEG